jgi:hypothetical protein
MKKTILLLLLPIIIFAQHKPIIFNPTNKIYYGLEVGTNDIISNSLSNGLHAQFGITAEYFISKKWSVQGKLKYYKTSLSYVDPSNFETKNPFLIFNGNVISIPITANWSFKISKNFRFFAAVGTTYNIETSNNYQIPSILNPDLSNIKKQYFTSTSTFGLTNAISKNDILYLSIEGNSGSNKAYLDEFLIGNNVKINNSLFNMGIKHNFKN